ncbi:AAA family ATPase [Marinobacter sp. BGYM27]|uniref:AAA family ATPase n=1 Tax=Marinobacter sp. BGYM27 TaxID=2975597 RepID=UPI0021A28378|nr:AAA family ATPase [Marinobacter sp. BGYM27]MDG5499942.1 AAA family ATPase [Marinobacter sp. BGYM27]
MELRKLCISGLFGHFNHIIPLNDENITIITAPNGYGKTIALKIIDAVFNRKFGFIAALQFQSIELVTDSDVLTVAKENPEEGNFVLSSDRYPENPMQYNSDKVRRRLRGVSLNEVDTRIPYLQRIDMEHWEDMRSGELHDIDSLIENFSQHFPEGTPATSIPDWYKATCDQLTAHFIQDQRLILKRLEPSRRRAQHFINTIEKYAQDLARRIKEAGFNSQRISQNLDTSFPERLLQKKSEFEAFEIDQLKLELQELQRKREQLSRFSLLSSERHLPQLNVLDEIKEEDKKVLTLYVKDTKQKLEAYTPLLNKIQLFFSILNEKRLSFKRVEIDQESGFRFETEESRPLELTQLSSGEQHQVVLLYELIFNTQENVLVLIDEPEISLHVAWQKEFLNDLKKIIALQNMPVVIATHSPQIIDENWHLTVDLEEGAVA